MQILATFRDTINPGMMVINNSYSGVLAYANGPRQWPGEEIKRFTYAGKHLYRIDVTGALPEGASILDVERYDATPATARTWVPRRNAFRGDATVYCSMSAIPAVADALDGERCWLICADWNNDVVNDVQALQLPPNITLCAVQYASLPAYDLTAVLSAGWLGRH